MIVWDWVACGGLLVSAIVAATTQRRWLSGLIVLALLAVLLWHSLLFEVAARHCLDIAGSEMSPIERQGYRDGLLAMDRVIRPLRDYMVVCGVALAIVSGWRIRRR